MVADIRPDYDTEWAAMKAVASQLGVGSAETLRQWVRRDQVDSGTRPGVTTEESAQVEALSRRHDACSPRQSTTPAHYLQPVPGGVTETLGDRQRSTGRISASWPT
ncbi:hypothetical protein ACFZAR_41330 [Streptomyces sp. NPDC008222]|uniref:hypothetical protein n=1 Tax=Streptomyces sp. NPDC008222 TaxID=3364820 RepID=UPI0036E0682B